MASFRRRLVAGCNDISLPTINKNCTLGIPIRWKLHFTHRIDENWDALEKKPERPDEGPDWELGGMSSNLESLSVAQQQNDLESMEGIEGSNSTLTTLRREYRSLSGGVPEGLNQS